LLPDACALEIGPNGETTINVDRIIEQMIKTLFCFNFFVPPLLGIFFIAPLLGAPRDLRSFNAKSRRGSRIPVKGLDREVFTYKRGLLALSEKSKSDDQSAYLFEFADT